MSTTIDLTAIRPIEPHSQLAIAYPGHTVYIEYPGADDGSGSHRTFRDEIDAHQWLQEHGYRQSGDLTTSEYTGVRDALTRRIKALCDGIKEEAR